jgi:exopolysaccharide biosynthesis polyprenyl glycosylphosphotransferase
MCYPKNRFAPAKHHTEKGFAPTKYNCMKQSKIFLGLLRIPVDFLMGIAAFFLAYELRSVTDLIPGVQLSLDMNLFPPLQQYLTFSTTALTVLILLLAINRMYSLKDRPNISHEIGRIMIISTAWLGLIIGYFFIIREFPFSRLAIIYSWLLTTILIILGRLLIRGIERFLLKFGIGKKRVLFIGNNSITSKLFKIMSKDASLRIVGLIDDHQDNSSFIKQLGNIKELAEIVKKFDIEEIIQTKSDLTNTQSTDILDFCRENHIYYRFVPDLLAVHQTNIAVETLSGIPIITLKPTPLDGWGRVLKRIFDFFGSLIGLIILSPVLLISAIAIKLDSKGTIFFKYLDDGSRAKRVGEHGRLINFYKFRTMHPNTHNLRYTELAQQNSRKGSPLAKIKDDPRITRVGKFLRKTSIDELPQLFNVLKGEMSLVGPRPHLPEEVANYQKHHKFVLTIKPGITGMAQISGRSDLDFEEEVRLDTYYIEHWSLWLDIKIILRTIFVLWKAYKE